jgi:hypothetical protein
VLDAYNLHLVVYFWQPHEYDIGFHVIMAFIDLDHRRVSYCMFKPVQGVLTFLWNVFDKYARLPFTIIGYYLPTSASLSAWQQQ